MIALVTGSPGSGKSYYACRVIAQALLEKKPVATNIALVDGWERRVIKSNPVNWLMPWTWQRKADRLASMVFVSADLEELFRVRLAGSKEGRGIMVLDECHTWLNSRTWDQSTDGREEKGAAVRNRLRVVRFFSAHRHLGWDIYAITQDANNIDRQVRSLFEYHVRLKNLRRAKIAGIPISPVNLFLAIWVWNDKGNTIVKRQMYRLTRVARIYRTHALSGDLDLELDGDPIPLPRPMEGGGRDGRQASPAPDPTPAPAPARRTASVAPRRPSTGARRVPRAPGSNSLALPAVDAQAVALVQLAERVDGLEAQGEALPTQPRGVPVEGQAVRVSK